MSRLALTIAITATIAEAAVRGIGVNDASVVSFGVGVLIVLVGVGVRDWAVRTRSPFAAGAAAPSGPGSLDHAGPYSRMRHPTHLGALLMVAGVVIALASVAGAIAFALLVVPAYRRRARIEESVLINTVGPPYLAYREQVPAFLPRPFGRTLQHRAPP